MTHFHHQGYTYLSKITLSNLSQVVTRPLPDDQAFKYMSLWGHSDSHHHRHRLVDYLLRCYDPLELLLGLGTSLSSFAMKTTHSLCSGGGFGGTR